MKKKRVVAHAFVTLHTGGAEQHLLTILRHLDRDTYDPRVVCFAQAGEMASDIRAQDIEIVSLGIPPRRLSRPRSLLQIARTLKNMDVDILHTHLRHASKYGRLAALLARTPAMVMTVHDVDAHQKRGDRLVNRLLDSRTHYTIAVSDAVRDSLRREGGFDERRLVVLPHGVSLPDLSQREMRRHAVRRELGILPDRLVIAMAARLVPVKRTDLLIRAFASVSADAPRAHLLIVGDGPERDRLEDLAMETSVAHRVTFTGRRRDVDALLLASDIFALPSDSEAAGIALLEAMAAALPAVVSRVGGMPEIVGSSCGVQFEAGDVDALADGLRQLLSDGALRLRMGTAARERAEKHYSAAAMVRKLEDIYARLP